jgi:hypothetical protein
MSKNLSKIADEDGGDGIIKNNTITAKVVNGLSFDVDFIRLEIGYDKGNDDWDVYVAANAPYVNGGFRLKLPANVNDRYLFPIDEEGYFPAGITVSHRNVKISMWDDGQNLYAYKANNCVGDIRHGIGDWGSSQVYANGDVSITGTSTNTDTNWDDITFVDTFIFNVHLKKGWNILYMREMSKGNNQYVYEVTTPPPSGADWYFRTY